MPSSSTSKLPSGIAPSLIGKFSGFTISLSGNFPSGVTHDEVRRLIIALGGKFETTDITKCTHVIASSKKLKTVKVRSARASDDCQLVTYDWLLGIISEESSDIKQLLGKLTTLNISEKPPNNKRKLEADPGDDISKKLTKTAEDTEVSIPVEVLEDGTRIPLNSTKLNEAVNSLLSLMSSNEFEQYTQNWIKGLPTGPKTRPPFSPNPDARKQEYIHALQKFEASLNHDTTDVLYRGLLSLQLTELTALNKQGEEFKIIAEYHSKSAPTYPNQIVDIFRIERYGEKDKFEAWRRKQAETIGDRRLVWHGSAKSSFVGILSQGLHVNNGGVWFAEMADVSIAYCDRRVVNLTPAFSQDRLMLLSRDANWYSSDDSEPLLAYPIMQNGVMLAVFTLISREPNYQTSADPNIQR
ncbi:NAD+ ADP-ribosyltransferase [Penicillium brevicompactum]|uniref:uncharacterized protein n=1 Tax=Penicillium brevicompactum TaxID=5074 RepID=UPI00253F9A87|nr:uncharacterized protein N7506_002305 [Penicillium brevicompactum]KAJ5349052.1 hypothetical protein N7506_002305 [Penicillium brevicompactum]